MNALSVEATAQELMAHRGLSFGDLARLRDALEERFAACPNETRARDLVLFYFLRDTAVRARELLSLGESGRLFTEDGHTAYRFQRLKKRRPTLALAVPGTRAVQALAVYRGITGTPGDALFWSLPDRNGARRPLTYRSLHRIVRGWGVTLDVVIRGDRHNTRTGEITRLLAPHAFRHTMLQKVVQVYGAEVARQLAGHSDIRITRGYLRQWVAVADVWEQTPAVHGLSEDAVGVARMYDGLTGEDRRMVRETLERLVAPATPV